ncbi:MAG TPA: MarR family transcriptional regulator [Bdellovibrionota bacterium]|nr:MarR family transcriptional regulator [Bdellovibrionota bacterium]
MSESTHFLSILQLGIRIQHVNQKLERDTGMSLTQWSLLKCLVDHPTISALDLADLLGIQASSLTQSIKRLQKKGLIVVAKDPLDARRKLLSVTREGNARLLQVDRKLKTWQSSAKLSSSSVQEVFRELKEFL